jgi:esterase/lipase superfamily enzyme
MLDRESGQIPSRHLGREVEFYWYGASGRPVVLFPTSAGRHNENEDFGLVPALAPKIAAGEIQVCCPDSINRESWADSTLAPWEKLRRHELYDRFLAGEFFPYVAARAGRGDVVLYGASLGGWQAVTFAARHPEMVGRVVAFSGFFDARRLLKGWWSEAAYFFSPADFISNMDAGWVQRLARVGWVVATGETDSLVEETRNLSRVLRQKGIPHHAEIWPGVFGHDWPFWKQHLPRFVP